MSPTPHTAALTASENTMRWGVTHPRKHWILHASELKPRTWEDCMRFLVLYLTTPAKTASGSWSVLQLYRRTLHALQVLGGQPDQLPQMPKGIGPDTCLWVFVLGVNGKIFGPFRPTAAPRLKIVPEGALLHFTAQARFLPPPSTMGGNGASN